jgi:Tfp pilus assembly PilM family ATPase
MPAYYEDIPIKDSHEIRNIVANKISELNQQQFIFSEAYLFGDIASISIANTLSDECGMNFKLVNPFTQFKTATNLMTNKYYTETNHFFTPSAGIAIRL